MSCGKLPLKTKHEPNQSVVNRQERNNKSCPLESKSQNKVLKHIKKSNVMKTKYIIIGTETEF